MDTDFKVDDWLDRFADELGGGTGKPALSSQWITRGTWNRNSWLHARVLAMLVRSVPARFVPMLEVKWNKRFVPDLCIVDMEIDASDGTVALVEYESTNSSDERLIGKDLHHFEKTICDYDSPSSHTKFRWKARNSRLR